MGLCLYSSRLSFSLVPELPSPCSNSLSGSGVCCQITPDGHAGKLHSWGTSQLMPLCIALSLCELSGQESGSSPGPMCHTAQRHSVSRAGAWWGMQPSMGPCLWGLASNHAEPKPWVVLVSAIHVGQRKSPRSQKAKHPRVQESNSQERELLLTLYLKVLSQNQMCSGSQWECPAFQPMRAVSAIFAFIFLPAAMFSKDTKSWTSILCINSLLLNHEWLVWFRQSPSSGGPSLYREDKSLWIFSSTLWFSPQPLPSLSGLTWCRAEINLIFIIVIPNLNSFISEDRNPNWVWVQFGNIRMVCDKTF